MLINHNHCSSFTEKLANLVFFDRFLVIECIAGEHYLVDCLEQLRPRIHETNNALAIDTVSFYNARSLIQMRPAVKSQLYF